MHPESVVVTSDLCFFSGLERVKKRYPDRLYNVGIAEQNMIGVAAGLAKEGYVPIATTYASFCASRCADQVRTCMSYMKLPIKLIGLTAGFGAGILGATHMAVEDISVMRALPNITVISPADCTEIIKALIDSFSISSPVYIRLTGPINTPIVYHDDYDFKIGKAIELEQGDDICLIATGSMVSIALKTSELLRNEKISTTVINVHTIKPIDREVIVKASLKHQLMVTIEEHNTIGGLYSAVSECLASMKNHAPTISAGIPDIFISAGRYDYQIEKSNLTPSLLRDRIIKLFKQIAS